MLTDAAQTVWVYRTQLRAASCRASDFHSSLSTCEHSIRKGTLDQNPSKQAIMRSATKGSRVTTSRLEHNLTSALPARVLCTPQHCWIGCTGRKNAPLRNATAVRANNNNSNGFISSSAALSSPSKSASLERTSFSASEQKSWVSFSMIRCAIYTGIGAIPLGPHQSCLV